MIGAEEKEFRDWVKKEVEQNGLLEIRVLLENLIDDNNREEVFRELNKINRHIDIIKKIDGLIEILQKLKVLIGVKNGVVEETRDL